jgi:molecular chaperone GrpE
MTQSKRPPSPARAGRNDASPVPAQAPDGAVLVERLTALEAEAIAATERADVAEAKRDEYLDDLRRLAAEFDNYKKRQARLGEQMQATANERLVRDLLPVLDDLERALEAFADHSPAAVQEGVALVHRSLRTTLEKEGLTEIDPEGGVFDPHEHEALALQPAAHVEEGTVLEVVQRGFRLGDRVVRPARVVVATAPERQ